jgi:hypothetical protein
MALSLLQRLLSKSRPLSRSGGKKFSGKSFVPILESLDDRIVPAVTAILPVPNAPVRVERSLGQLLLEGVPFDLVLVDLNPEAGPRTGADHPALFIDQESFPHHVPPPRHVAVHGFADDIRRAGEAQFQ